MDIDSVCIVGGSGYVGRSIADHIAASGRRARVVTRSRPRAMHVTVLPTVELVVADPHAPADLDRAFAGMDAALLKTVEANRKALEIGRASCRERVLYTV